MAGIRLSCANDKSCELVPDEDITNNRGIDLHHSRSRRVEAAGFPQPHLTIGVNAAARPSGSHNNGKAETTRAGGQIFLPRAAMLGPASAITGAQHRINVNRYPEARRRIASESARRSVAKSRNVLFSNGG